MVHFVEEAPGHLWRNASPYGGCTILDPLNQPAHGIIVHTDDEHQGAQTNLTRRRSSNFLLLN